jgi:hypothetical protein
MSDPNLTDKFVENINNAFKKTKIFEKMETTYFSINSIIVISSIIGLTSIYINYYNLDKIKRLEEKIKESVEINQKQNQTIINKLVEQAKNADDNSYKLITENQYFKPEMISASTSISSFSPNLPPKNDDNDVIDKKNNDDDELINECYDSIPLNNLKKNTGLNWFLK